MIPNILGFFLWALIVCAMGIVGWLFQIAKEHFQEEGDRKDSNWYALPVLLFALLEYATFVAVILLSLERIINLFK